MYESILNSVKNYILMDLLGQAMLIDGEWGGGKTYFIKNVLMKNEIVNTKNIFYISLYGKSKLADIDTAICAKIVEKKIENTNRVLEFIVNSYNKIKRVFNFKNISVYGVNLEIDTNQIIQEFLLDYDQILFIFDDFERCSINYKDLLGYINNIVEHKSGKVLIVANENIIKQNVEGEEYLKAKEKVIHSTIKFENNIEVVLSSLISDEDDAGYKELLELKQNVILDRFKKCECKNIRVLAFSLFVIKEVYMHLVSSLEELNKSDRDYLLDQLIDYIVFASINFKTKGRITEWSNNEAWKTINVDSNIYNTIYGFHFIDEYISKLLLLDKEQIYKSLSDLITLNLNHNLSIHKLKYWERLDYNQFLTLLDQLSSELELNQYPLPLYKNILILITEIYKYSLLSKCHEYKLEQLLNQISKNFEDWPTIINIDLTCYNEELNNLYEEKIKYIREAIKNRNNKIERHLLLESYINLDEEHLLMDIISKYKSEYLMQKSFFSYMGTLDNLIKYCKDCSNYKLIDLRNVLYEMYHRNGQYYKNDINLLEKFNAALLDLINTVDDIDNIKLQNLKFINNDINGYIEELKS